MTLRSNLLAGVLMAGCAGLALPAAAQDNPGQGIVEADYDRDIIVSAQPDPEPEGGEVNRQSRSITMATNVFSEPLARFEKPVCPGVSGLPEELGNYVVDRIRFNVERVGLDLAEAGDCRINLLVSFVVDGRSSLAELADSSDSLLYRIPLSERREVLNESGPVRAWTITSVRSRDGVPIEGDRYRGEVPTVRTQSANSLFLSVIRKDIEMAIIVIDVPAIDGLGAVQIADYATMRGLAQTRPIEGNATYGTILNLFDEDGLHAPELTTFDLAYLNAMYSGVPNIAGASKIGTVRTMMDRELAAAQAELEDYSRNE